MHTDKLILDMWTITSYEGYNRKEWNFTGRWYIEDDTSLRLEIVVDYISDAWKFLWFIPIKKKVKTRVFWRSESAFSYEFVKVINDCNCKG